jgi:cytidine deaminase
MAAGISINSNIREELIRAAEQAARSAYAPYSRFRVGAAVLDEQGNIYPGANIENASYGLTICAERVALFRAVLSGSRQISAIALACVDADASAPLGTMMPCGACRQVMAEFGDPNTSVFVKGAGDFSLSELLPNPFRLR